MAWPFSPTCSQIIQKKERKDSKKDADEVKSSTIPVGESLWMIIVVFSNFSVWLKILKIKSGGEQKEVPDSEKWTVIHLLWVWERGGEGIGQW